MRQGIGDEQHLSPNVSVLKLYKKGTYIYAPETAANEIYIIKKGIVKIIYPSFKNKKIYNPITKSLLLPDSIFGEMVLAGERFRRDYAYVVETAEIQVYKKADFQKLLQSKPHIHKLVLQQMGQKLRTIENRFADVILKDARSRIIEFLLDLAQKRGVQIGFDTLIKDALSQQEIANYTATARQTVSTVLNRLREKNLIYYTRKKMMIRDINLLQQELLTDNLVSNS